MEYIRKLDNSDYESFKKVFSVFEAEPFYEAWTEEEYAYEFLDFIKNGEIYGIFFGNTIWGLITIKEKYLKWEKLQNLFIFLILLFVRRQEIKDMRLS